MPLIGEYVLDSLKVDDGYIAKSVVWQIDDRIHIRSENGAGTAKIAKHSIHYSPALDGAILLAVAEPEGTFEVKDTHLLVVAKEPFSCRIPCSNDRIVPDQKTSGQIQDVLATGLKKSAKEIVTKFAALRGSFTKHYAVQYVA